MSSIDRRTFIGQAVAAIGTAVTGHAWTARAETAVATSRSTVAPPDRFLSATDTVKLGSTGVTPSRLAIGTGTKVSKQRELGERGLVRMLRHGFDQGVRWWEAADLYGTHSYLRLGLREVDRERVVITSKSSARTADGMRADLERIRQELGTDYVDVFLMHCLTDGDWPKKLGGAMDVLSEAKQKGLVRAVGCSFHSLDALRAAVDEPWVEVILARINPFAMLMDVGKPQEVPKVVEVLQSADARGKAVYGMKILGEGGLQPQQIEPALKFAMEQTYLSGFTIGFRSQAEIDDVVRRIQAFAIRRA